MHFICENTSKDYFGQMENLFLNNCSIKRLAMKLLNIYQSKLE